MPFQGDPAPIHQNQTKGSPKPTVRQESKGDFSPNVTTGNNSTVVIGSQQYSGMLIPSGDATPDFSSWSDGITIPADAMLLRFGNSLVFSADPNLDIVIVRMDGEDMLSIKKDKAGLKINVGWPPELRQAVKTLLTVR